MDSRLRGNDDVGNQSLGRWLLAAAGQAGGGGRAVDSRFLGNDVCGVGDEADDQPLGRWLLAEAGRAGEGAGRGFPLPQE